MGKCSVTLVVVALACLSGPARAEADESAAREIAKATLDKLDVKEKAHSQIRSLLADQAKPCEEGRADVEADLDIRLRHVKNLSARIKDLRERADAETLAEADRQVKTDSEAKVQRTLAKEPETQRVLSRYHLRCMQDSILLKQKIQKLAQAME